ncbi:MAG: hypothetical protein HAW67_00490 [Endozoicomonadaceae bacterium]|nr:hypothetical protein [Endozoicomonadaceae bacterium]MBE8232180.1 hypothetical protein [Endozoicomonadaceae bacterium]
MPLIQQNKISEPIYNPDKISQDNAHLSGQPAKVNNIEKASVLDAKPLTISKKSEQVLPKALPEDVLPIQAPDPKIQHTAETVAKLDNIKTTISSVESALETFTQEKSVEAPLDQLIKAASQQDEAAFTDLATQFNIESPENIMQMITASEDMIDIEAHIQNIESAPPEVMKKLMSLQLEMTQKMSVGDIDSVSQLISEVQTKLKDTQIKFNQEGIILAQAKNKSLSEQRTVKMVETLKKLAEQSKSDLIGRIFGGIAAAFAMIVSAVLIATGVLSKVGIILTVVSIALMTAMTVSQNTGNWMNKIFGSSDKAQLAAGIMWSILAVALSLGGGAATANKGSYDVATQSIQVVNKFARVASAIKQVGKIGAPLLRHFSKIGQGVSLIGQGSAEMYSGAISIETGKLKAETTRLTAFITEMQLMMDNMVDVLQKIMRELDEGISMSSDLIKDSIEGKTRLAKNI